MVVSVMSGTTTQGGVTSPPLTITVGGKTATLTFAELVFPGLFQINLTVPVSLADGEQTIKATCGGAAPQSSALLSVHQ